MSTGSALLHYGTLKIDYRLTYVKALPPLVTIKGEAWHPLANKFNTQIQHIRQHIPHT